ncbi:MAG: HAMP domain-containing protein, partial [SAR324 cluster bacterium]|nr:HAMP domain-containing protein [SAR324 cluster bacterium]
MKQRRLSIKVTISLVLFCISALDISVLSVMLFHNSSSLLREQIRENYSMSVKHMGELITNRLTLFEDEMRELSKSTILMNGLVDDAGREAYLPQFISEISVSGMKKDISVSLYNYSLELLASNNPEWERLYGELLDSYKMQEIILDDGQQYNNFTRIKTGEVLYVLALPVYSGPHHDGILVAVLHWDSVWKKIPKQADMVLSLLHEGDPIVTAGNMAVEGEIREFSLDRFYSLTLMTKIPETLISEPIYAMEIQMITLGGLLLIIMIGINLLVLTRKIANPVIQLERAAANVAKGKWDMVQLHNASLEINDLANTFNSMTARLRATRLKDHRQTMAMNAVLEGIGILDARDHYIYMNAAHARMYGYADPSELLGQKWTMFYTDTEYQRFMREIMPVF